jgi:spore coat protein H
MISEVMGSGTRAPRRVILAVLWVWMVLGAASVPAALNRIDPALLRAQADALFTNGVVLNLKIEIPATNVTQLGKEPHKYVLATLREGAAVYADVALHLKGSAGSFRPINDKPGFTISFKAFESDTNFHGLTRFHLNNSVQDGTYLSDWFCGELFRRAGVPAPRYAHALVELNGRKLGLYVLMEGMDREFLQYYFQNTRGNLYGQSGGGDITEALERMEGKGPLDRADLKSLVEAVQETDAGKRWPRLREKLDVDRFISFMVMEVMLCDWDGYTFASHNYRVFQDLDTGRMVFLPHDKDQMIGDQNLPFLPVQAGGMVARAIAQTPEARLKYRERFGLLFTNVFKAPALTNEINQLVARLLPGLRAYDSNFARDFVNNAESLKNRVLSRRQGLEEQFGVPAPTLLQFANNVARLGAWEAQKDEGNLKLAITQGNDKLLLHLQSEGGGCRGSWKTSFLLGPGTYRFSGLAKTDHLQAYGSDTGHGGGLRSSGSRRQNQMEGTKDWTRLEHTFSLSELGEVSLLCEFHGGKGAIWFDAASLQLERLK